MVLGEIAYIPPLLSCLSVCVWSSPKIKPGSLVRISLATILHTLLLSVLAKIWIWWSVSFLFCDIHFVVLIQILQTHCFVALCRLSNVDGSLMCRALMTSILQQWQLRLSWCMWRPMRVPIMAWQNVIICCVDAGGFWSCSRFNHFCRDNSQLKCSVVKSGYTSCHANHQITFSF